MKNTQHTFYIAMCIIFLFNKTCKSCWDTMIHVNRFQQDRYFLSGGLHGMLAVGTLTGAMSSAVVR